MIGCRRVVWRAARLTVCFALSIGACSPGATDSPRPFSGALKGARVSPSTPLSEASEHADELCHAFSDALRRLVSAKAAAGYCQQSQFLRAAFGDAGAEASIEVCESAEQTCLSDTSPEAYTLCPMLLYQTHQCSVPLSGADTCYADYIANLTEFWALSCIDLAALGDQIVPLPESCNSIAAECSLSVRSLRPWSN